MIDIQHTHKKRIYNVQILKVMGGEGKSPEAINEMKRKKNSRDY